MIGRITAPSSLEQPWFGHPRRDGCIPPQPAVVNAGSVGDGRERRHINRVLSPGLGRRRDLEQHIKIAKVELGLVPVRDE